MRVGDYVVVPEQDAVEGAGYRDLRWTIGGGDLALDQLVDNRVGDTDVIAAARRLRRRTRPEVALLIARAQGLAPRGDDDVEVKVLDAVLVLRRVNGADGRLNAEAFEVLHEGAEDALVRRGPEQKFKAHYLASLSVG